MAFERNDDYIEVAERLVTFHEKFPEGSLSSEVSFHTLPVPTKIKVGGKEVDMPTSTIVVCRAEAHRYPGDPDPAVGIAGEPFPGKTPYTRDSEVQNAETSAWGRAIVATGITGTKHIASANEVRNRRSGDDEASSRPAKKATAAKKAAPKTAAPSTPPAEEQAPTPAPEPEGSPEESKNLLGETDALEGWASKAQQDECHVKVIAALKALSKPLKDEYKKTWKGPKGHDNRLAVVPLPLEDWKKWAAVVKTYAAMNEMGGEVAA